MKTKLSMSVERLPNVEGLPVEKRGRLVARICVEFVDGRGRDVTLLADDDGLFDEAAVRSMLRHMEKALDMPYLAA